jgi:uncharacterized protein (DUF2342 family)
MVRSRTAGSAGPIAYDSVNDIVTPQSRHVTPMDAAADGNTVDGSGLAGN